MKENSLMNSLSGILPAFFFGKPSNVSTVEERYIRAVPDDQLTGVARYLKKLEPQQPELDENGEVLTGVAKYLALHALAEKAKEVVEEVVAEPIAEELQIVRSAGQCL